MDEREHQGCELCGSCGRHDCLWTKHHYGPSKAELEQQTKLMQRTADVLEVLMERRAQPKQAPEQVKIDEQVMQELEHELLHAAPAARTVAPRTPGAQVGARGLF
jgi:hypothetical protein